MAKPDNDAPTTPRAGRIKTPVEHGRRDHTSGIDTAETRDSPRSANVDTPQQKYSDRGE